MIAAAWGAEIDEPETRNSSKALPAHMIDPKRGGEVTPLYGADEIASLPIGLGYSIINKGEMPDEGI